jgi:hypothetical protein
MIPEVSTMAHTTETRWIVLATDGRHVTLGRHTDPTEEEIEATEAALKRAGRSGWLAVMKGGYYSRRPIELLMVRPLGGPEDAWNDAARAFEAIRRAANGPS